MKKTKTKVTVNAESYVERFVREQRELQEMKQKMDKKNDGQIEGQMSIYDFKELMNEPDRDRGDE